MTVLRSGSATDVGRVRTVNEDRALESMTLFAVADGMGGHAGGEVASGTAIEAFQREFSRQPTVAGLTAAVHQANRSVYERSLEDAELRGMGTTLTAAALVATDEGDRLALANVGDSRSYVLHDGELTQLSHDHSVAEELVDRGELSEAEAAVHPHRHILTRALGVSSDVDVDIWQVVPTAGDRYLLCSDGLTNEVPEPRIAKILATTADPQEAADTLVRLANENGGNDNITVVVLDVLIGEEASADGAAPAVAAAVAPVGVGDAPGAARRTVASAVPTAPERPESPTLLGRAGSDAAAGMRAMHARASEVSDRLRSRRITFRVLLFVLVLAAIAAGAYIAVRWYVDSSYFVKLTSGAQGQVEIFQGRQGGFAGIQPKVVERTGIVASQIPNYYLGFVRAGVEEPSLKAARRYVAQLRAAPGFGPAPTSTTTTTAPVTTTTGGG
ncbi:MAG: Stp1/IreP family PP2C-type Ser/Thr phosphatase [Acidobacteriota bacterium]|nr:Stp1/IreP family PP2C-type Ser/Thr phosphatase [Acidobacteriota bacterium]